MFKNIFAKPNQHYFGACHYDEAYPGEAIPEVKQQFDNNIQVLTSKAPIAEQNKMFERLFDTMIVKKNQTNPKTGKIVIANVQSRVNAVVDRMFKYESKYQKVTSAYTVLMRWYHLALIYKMESNEPREDRDPTWKYYLGNGQPISMRTTIVPKGWGPFPTWEAGCHHAIKLQGLDKKTDWSIGSSLRLLEGFNGTGYRDYHNMQSAYMFSGSNHYVKGKYTSDGKFDPNYVSEQIGVALYLQEILKRLKLI